MCTAGQRVSLTITVLSSSPLTSILFVAMDESVDDFSFFISFLLPSFPFLGSSPVGDDDLRYYNIRRVSPFLVSGPVGDNDLWFHHIPGTLHSVCLSVSVPPTPGSQLVTRSSELTQKPFQMVQGSPR